MPILKLEQETKEIILPESKAKVKIIINASYGLMIRAYKVLSDDIALLAEFILDWDFTDEKLTKIPVNPDTVKSLSKEDGKFLMTEISENFDQKKTLASK
jgi:hypothetical protein